MREANIVKRQNLDSPMTLLQQKMIQIYHFPDLQGKNRWTKIVNGSCPAGALCKRKTVHLKHLIYDKRPVVLDKTRIACLRTYRKMKAKKKDYLLNARSKSR